MQRPTGLRQWTNFDARKGLEKNFIIVVWGFPIKMWCSDNLHLNPLLNLLSMQIYGTLSLSFESKSPGGGTLEFLQTPQVGKASLKNRSNKKDPFITPSSWLLLFQKKKRRKYSMHLMLENVLFTTMSINHRNTTRPAYNWVCLGFKSICSYFWG